jgi:hypothetical protein
MKNKNLWLGILALVFGMTVVECNNGSTGDDSGNGVNAVSGKTCFVTRQVKIDFSTTADRDTNGTYTVGRAIFDDEADQFELDENGKYKYMDIETGTYIWNENARTISLKPEDETSDDKIFTYSFSADGTALFLEEALPVNEGKNEFSSETYNGTTLDTDRKPIKDTNQVFVFTVSGYTFTMNFGQGYPTETETGSYAYDSNLTLVWLRPSTKNGKNRAAYYAEQTATNGHNLVDDNAFRAAMTNEAFSIWNGQYFSISKVIMGMEE